MEAPHPDYPAPDLGYRYTFAPHETPEIVACTNAHGFAVVKGMIPPDWVADLRESVVQTTDPQATLQPGETRVRHAFIEASPTMLKVLRHRPFMEIAYALLGSRDLVLNRSAAILKAPGTGVGAWHTDWRPPTDNPQTPDDVLNSGEWPSGLWFYLNGTHPSRGGLALIEDSHTPDWPGPEGFELLPDRKSFYRKGTPPGRYDKMDVPGLIPLYTDPGDLIIFAARTYHGVFPHNGTQPRTSCAVIFRKANDPAYIGTWQPTESARKFVESLPDDLKPLGREYIGFGKPNTY